MSRAFAVRRDAGESPDNMSDTLSGNLSNGEVDSISVGGRRCLLTKKHDPRSHTKRHEMPQAFRVSSCAFLDRFSAVSHCRVARFSSLSKGRKNILLIVENEAY